MAKQNQGSDMAKQNQGSDMAKQNQGWVSIDQGWVSIDELLSEERLSLTELARESGLSLSTPWRWCLDGCRGVKLQSFNEGAKRYTTRQAHRRFCEASTAAASNQPMPAAARTPKQREKAISAAEAELEKAGV